MIMAGGAGERLQPLTRERSKGAVPFGGKFRLVDLTLSNCINSGLRHIYVLTQYLSESLNRHIQEGWAISSAGLGDYIYCIPAQQKLGTSWYLGTADAVRQNLDLINREHVDHVLVLSSDHIYKMNYRQMVEVHVRTQAGLTISAVRVKKEQAARRLGVLETARDHRLTGFAEKAAQPKAIARDSDWVQASMGVYLFKVDVLLQVLQIGGHDFGKDIVPAMMGRGDDIFVYDYEKENRIEDFETIVKNGVRESRLVERTSDSMYWKDVGSLDAYFDANMALVEVDPPFSLYGGRWPVRTFQRPMPPSKCILGGRISDSIVCDGCLVSGGAVCGSILSPGVIVERDALVEQSVIFDDVIIEPGARLRRAIVDKRTVIRAGVSVGHNPQEDKKRGFMISDNGIVIVPKGMDVR